jgi:hypothetical protein
MNNLLVGVSKCQGCNSERYLGIAAIKSRTSTSRGVDVQHPPTKRGCFIYYFETMLLQAS